MNCTINGKKYDPVTAIAWWPKGNDDPIYLVTNFISASKACVYYKKRFIIETFFSNQKSRGFNIYKCHLSLFFNKDTACADIIAFVRRHVWCFRNYTKSNQNVDLNNFKDDFFETILDVLCYTT